MKMSSLVLSESKCKHGVCTQSTAERLGFKCPFCKMPLVKSEDGLYSVKVYKYQFNFDSVREVISIIKKLPKENLAWWIYGTKNEPMPEQRNFCEIWIRGIPFDDFKLLLQGTALETVKEKNT